jgi:heat-inducible transcriptional repressor
MTHDERRLQVLRAIVEDFVSTNDPVGSKALVDRHSLGVSAATIRNDMAVLEDEGYITQPHTSAGRVPTDKGYRLFVDRLTQIKPMTAAERKAIQSFLDGAVDLDDVLGRTVRLLAQLTRQVAVVQYPTLAHSGIRHVEVFPLSTSRIMLVVITDSGRIEQRVIALNVEVTEEQVADLRSNLNTAIGGLRLTDASSKVADLARSVPTEIRPLAASVASVLLETLVEQPDTRIVVGGTANLTRDLHDFPMSLRPILEALEEQVVILRLIGEVDPSTVMVRIGEENEHAGLAAAAVVSAGYGDGTQQLGGLGVLGSKRMDYPSNISAVRAVARYVGRLVSGG